jgi:hypothetical protein
MVVEVQVEGMGCFFRTGWSELVSWEDEMVWIRESVSSDSRFLFRAESMDKEQERTVFEDDDEDNEEEDEDDEVDEDGVDDEAIDVCTIPLLAEVGIEESETVPSA